MRETKEIKAEGGVGNQKNNTCYSGKFLLLENFRFYLTFNEKDYVCPR